MVGAARRVQSRHVGNAETGGVPFDADVRMHVEEELSGFVTEILARYSRGGICAVADGDNNAVEAAPVDNGKPVGRRKPNPKPKGKSVAGAVEDEPDALSS
jgi:hypothetical protein